MKRTKNELLYKFCYSICSIFTFALIAVIVVSCGGGGGDGGGPIPGSVDPSTAPKIASSVGNLTTGIEAATMPITLDVGSGAYSPQTLLKHAHDLIANKEKIEADKLFAANSLLQPAGSSSVQSNCTDGGSVTITLIWEGPDYYADCSQVINPSMEFSFVDCQEGAETMNGIMGMDLQGNLCTENPSAFGLYFNSLRYQNQSDNSDTTLNLTMDLTGIAYDVNGYMKSMNISMDGSINGTFKGTAAQMDYNNWTLSASNITYDDSNQIAVAEMTINGSFSGNIHGNLFDESYSKISISYQHTTVDSVSGELITLKGKYKGACLDGWVTLDTIEPVFSPVSSDCPTVGQVKISGKGEATVFFNSDNSVNINVDDKELVYTNCEDLPNCIS